MFTDVYKYKFVINKDDEILVQININKNKNQILLDTKLKI